MTDKLEFLTELPIFADLSPAALDAVARITREYAFDDDAVIAYQRDIANRLFIVKEGRLFARALDNNGITRETYSFLPKQYFNEHWLFVPGVHSATIKGKGTAGGRLYVIEGPEFIQLLKRYPSIIDELAPREDDDIHFGLSDDAWIDPGSHTLVGALVHRIWSAGRPPCSCQPIMPQTGRPVGQARSAASHAGNLRGRHAGSR